MQKCRLLLYRVVFLLVRPNKWLSVRLHIDDDDISYLQQHITTDELCGICNVVLHWSCSKFIFFNKHLINGRIQTYLECNNPNDLNLTNQWYCHTKVLCVPWLRWKCPDLERPIRVRIGFLGIIEVDFYQTLICYLSSTQSSISISFSNKYHPHFQKMIFSHLYLRFLLPYPSST